MVNAMLRIPKSKIVKDDGDVVWIDVGDGETFVKQVMLAFVNQNKAVVMTDENEEEKI